MDEERRGLRFAFSAAAVIAPQGGAAAYIPARVTELSLRGCFLETAASFEIQRPVLVKIHHLGEDFEAEASVLYVKPSGMGMVFSEIKSHFRAVLQKWVLTALDSQSGTEETPG